ncbi:hypothetical protein [Saccharomonospora azurea]|nr:hypothetical protein [Saccharomonospora azurea]
MVVANAEHSASPHQAIGGRAGELARQLVVERVHHARAEQEAA